MSGSGRQPPAEGGTPISVSEGHGYGMMIVAHMAGYDKSAQQIFDGLYKFYRDHPSQHDPALMAWRQMSDCRSSADPNSATDGDLDLAYALLLADRQWGSKGAINYRAQALAMLAAIRRREIHVATSLPQMGDWVNPAFPREYNAVRSSDLAPSQFRSFWRASGDGGWKATLDSSYKLLDQMQLSYAPEDRPPAGLHRGQRHRTAPCRSGLQRRATRGNLCLQRLSRALASSDGLSSQWRKARQDGRRPAARLDPACYRR